MQSNRDAPHQSPDRPSSYIGGHPSGAVRMKPLFYSWLLIVAFDVADRNLIMRFDTESSCLRAQYEAWEAGGALVMPCRETGDPFVKADSDE